jgi:transcriptional regulator with GAF, ATPase, and Fis domain
MVGTSAAIGTVFREIEQVASTDAPVMILGETGTGKELVARALHHRSTRRDRPFVAINCAALPPALVESELFGHEKGAFTGAVARTIGRFEIADGGTIFLDEIGGLAQELQAKLLRVLQSGTFERVGSARSISVDVLVLAATHRDLEREVLDGRFRADLYYRLSVFPIRIPPLRERPDDIPLLVWHTIARRQMHLGKSIERVPDSMLRAFANYDWPGNVRELQNVIERAMIVTTGSTLAWNNGFLAGPKAKRASAGDTLASGDTLDRRGARPYRRGARGVRLQDRPQRQRRGAPGNEALHSAGAHEEARGHSPAALRRMVPAGPP